MGRVAVAFVPLPLRLLVWSLRAAVALAPIWVDVDAAEQAQHEPGNCQQGSRGNRRAAVRAPVQSREPAAVRADCRSRRS